MSALKTLLVQNEKRKIKGCTHYFVFNFFFFFLPQQQFSRTIKHLKEELARQQKLNSHLQTSELSNGVSPSSHLTHEIDVLRGDRESMKKEVFLLKKTAEEREIRIETQKQTLIAREESIKKLLEMLQSKGLR